MKRIKNIFVLVVILSIILSASALANDGNEEIKEMLSDFTIGENNIVYVGDGEGETATYTKRELFPPVDVFAAKVQSWAKVMPAEVLEYDEFLYQIIPLDYETSKEILQLQDQATKELEEKKNYIEEQKILLQKPDSDITIEQVNDLIDEYNMEFEKKAQEIREKLPQYNENNWQELKDRSMVYEDPTGNTAYALVYAKVTYSKFKGDKTIYASKLYPLSYQALSQMQSQDEEQKDDNKTENQDGETIQNNDNTQSPIKLPNAGISSAIILLMICVIILSIVFYKKHKYWKKI